MPACVFDNGTLAERVCDALRNEILNKTIKAGERITIKEISERYGVSNMPVREAFRVLEGESLLQMSAYKGAVVLPLDKQYILDVYGILRGLECVICESAIDHVTEDTISTMRGLNQRMSALTDTEEDQLTFVDCNTTFHEEIIALGTNKKAEELYHYYQQLVRSLRKNQNYFPSYQRIQKAAEDHRKMVEIFEKKEKSNIKRIIDEHSEGAMQDFLHQYTE